MTSETVGQMVTAFLVVVGWILSRIQVNKTHKEANKAREEVKKTREEVTEVKGMVNGPLLQSIRETAELARRISGLTGLPEDSALAMEKEKALDERIKSGTKETQL